jgi:transcriptional regulator with XRE-family HTH domain
MCPMSEHSSRWPTESEFAAVFGARLKELREQQGLSQRELAQKVEVSKSMITKYEGGVHAPPASLLVPLATFLGVTADCLLGYAVENPRLVRFLQEVESLHEGDRQAVAQLLESVASTCRRLLERPYEEPRS